MTQQIGNKKKLLLVSGACVLCMVVIISLALYSVWNGKAAEIPEATAEPEKIAAIEPVVATPSVAPIKPNAQAAAGVSDVANKPADSILNVSKEEHVETNLTEIVKPTAEPEKELTDEEKKAEHDSHTKPPESPSLEPPTVTPTPRPTTDPSKSGHTKPPTTAKPTVRQVTLPTPTPNPNATPTEKPTFTVPTIKPGNNSKPQTGDKKDGMYYVEGFGWIEDEGGGTVSKTSGSDGDIDKQVGIMGGGE